MADPPKLPPKKDVATALLQGPSVFIHLDPRRDGVIVPTWFKNQPQLVLQVGMNMAVPIPDLEVGDDGISCTLSFNRSPFWCSMPYSAIYALVGEDGRGMIWPDDVPPELASETKRPALKVVGSKQSPKKKPPKEAKIGDAKRPRLAALSSSDSDQPVEKAPVAEVGPPSTSTAPAAAAEEAPADDQSEGEGGAKRELPPYLRVIK